MIRRPPRSTLFPYTPLFRSRLAKIKSGLTKRVLGELKKTFRPEFLNRVDETIIFQPLTEDQIREIVDLMINEVRSRIEDRNISVVLTEGAKSWLAKEGFDPVFGARPLRRTIQREVENPLSKKILLGEFQEGDTVEVDSSPEGLVFSAVGDFLGIDQDSSLARHVPKGVADNFLAADVWRFLEDNAGGRRFDIAVLFDVLEHFTPEDGARLLKGLAGVLKPGGRVLLKLPNMGSPWGAKYQFGDLTHRAAYTPTSIRQLALASGYAGAVCYPHLEGSPVRRFTDRLFHGVVSRLLMSPPEIWSANFFALLEKAG